MDLEQRFENVAVLGAGGKMGSGIALLLAVEMAKRRVAAKKEGKPFRLTLIDTSDEALDGLIPYLQAQALRIAEKTTVALRGLYASRSDLVENTEMIQEFVREVTSGIRLSTELSAASKAHMVFEAIIENEEIKIKVYRELAEKCGSHTFFFTNTSSIPIHLVDEEAGLDGRIIGYHFYNPPPVQKLVELISTPKTRPELVKISNEIGRVLRKKIIPANDVAGFIGNGHFMRDGLHAIAKVEELSKDMSFVQALYAMNKVSQDYLVRPMGIFQLIDYVGIDVFQSILKVMNAHIKGAGLHSDLADMFVSKGVKGGQFSSGAQKDGFLKYGKKGPEGVYDPEKGEYVMFDKDGWCAEVDDKLGAMPDGWKPWKKLMRAGDKDEVLANWFKGVHGSGTLGCKLAVEYMLQSAEIAEGLVKDGVAAGVGDVNGVLMNGFYHIYGAVNDFTKGWKS